MSKDAPGRIELLQGTLDMLIAPQDELTIRSKHELPPALQLEAAMMLHMPLHGYFQRHIDEA